MSKLVFKGDKPKAIKRKREKTETNIQLYSPTDWVPCESAQDLTGPLFIYKKDHILSCLEYEPLSFRKHKESILEPKLTSQVIVSTRIPESTRTSLKTHFDKFIGCDNIGCVSTKREALGQAEQWVIEEVDGGFAFKSYFNKYLTISVGDQVAIVARADSDDVGLQETFSVKCQYQNKVTGKLKVVEDVDVDLVEGEKMKQFWSKGGNYKGKKSDIDDLKKAKEDGSLNEAMLNRRSKIKSDKFCK